jgi:hypothetical protein
LSLIKVQNSAKNTRIFEICSNDNFCWVNYRVNLRLNRLSNVVTYEFESLADALDNLAPITKGIYN